MLATSAPFPKSGVRPESVAYDRRDDLEARLLARRSRVRELLVQDADDLFGVLQARHHFTHAAASIREYGERVLRIGGSTASFLCSLGRALRRTPSLRPLVLSGEIVPENAVAYDRIAGHPEALRPDDRWLEWAARESAKFFSRRVDRRLREVEVREPTVEVCLPLTRQGAENLRDAQGLMSRSQGRAVSEAEVVERSVDCWLSHHDPRRKGGGTRRMASTEGIDRRSVPASVLRAILDQNGGKCQVDLCDNVPIEAAHRKAHADGGCQERHNLDGPCFGHHRFVDAGLLRREIRDGEVLLIDPNGSVISRRPNAPDP